MQEKRTAPKGAVLLLAGAASDRKQPNFSVSGAVIPSGRPYLSGISLAFCRAMTISGIRIM
jgi:hypothetical protein